uniref:Uncharacterized protein n=1 Tax=Anguilla anguilla TaxID=7936 RepID=A0A0E9TYP1_ANGAN
MKYISRLQLQIA